jgi:hypothetical protein
MANIATTFMAVGIIGRLAMENIEGTNIKSIQYP